MKKLACLLGSATFVLTACDDLGSTSGDSSGRFVKELPESVLAIAAPNQDLEAVRVDPSTGCYTYRYRGPVETTFLPLRSVEGRPICAVRADGTPAS